MLKKDFWYDLPKELIAQEPASPRDAARLMVLSQKDDSIQHKVFRDLPEFLEPGDLLVVINSKVLPARIVGVKQPTGAVCELLPMGEDGIRAGRLPYGTVRRQLRRSNDPRGEPPRPPPVSRTQPAASAAAERTSFRRIFIKDFPLLSLKF